MNSSRHFCYCWGGRSRWEILSEDRFCGQCGRRMRGVEPDGPVVAAGPPAVAVVYLGAAPGAAGARRYAGTLALQIRGPYETPPGLEWQPSGEAPLALAGFRLASPTRLIVAFEATAHRPLSAGALAGGRLTVVHCGERFEVPVQAYATVGLRAAVRAALRPGAPLNGSAFVLFRGAESAVTHLDAELGAGVPVQWEAAVCNHPAVSVRLLRPEVAAAVVRAEVQWDPGRLRGDRPGVEVEFTLRLRQLPPLTFRQSVWWRLRTPLECRPAALVVPRLVGERPQVHPIGLCNLDRQPLVLKRVESEAPWVTAPDLTAGAGLRIEPGGGGILPLELRPAALNGDQPPYQAQVVLHFAGRGRQLYQVRVESVRRTEPLFGPLLIDPGPPRLVLARIKEGTNRVVYFLGSGDAGLRPERLGWTREEYARAVYGAAPADCWPRLIQAACERLQEWEQLQAHEVHVCRHPWMANLNGLKGVSAVGWADLRPDARPVVRLDAWGASAATPDEAPAPGDPLGVDLVLWLLKELRVAGGRNPAELRAWLQQPPGFAGESAGRRAMAAGIRLSCEELLVDYRWGADHAWRRLLSAWREMFPLTRGAAFDVTAADRRLRECLGVQGRRLAAWLRQRLPGGPDAETLWICPLFAGRGFTDVLRSAARAAGVRAECLAPSWIEWRARAGRR